MCVTCDGPTTNDCLECVVNAHYVLGNCYCNEKWLGDSCDVYYGACDQLCNPFLGCKGPDCKDCIAWLPNVKTYKMSACECEINWGGQTCEAYQGPCHELCAGGCVGPSSSDCNL